MCRFNAEIDFDGSKLLERYMVRQDMPRMRGQFAAASHSDDEDDFENIMKAYGTEVVSLVGSEVRLRHCRELCACILCLVRTGTIMPACQLFEVGVCHTDPCMSESAGEPPASRRQPQ